MISIGLSIYNTGAHHGNVAENLISYSEDFAKPTWFKGGSVVALNAVGPNNVANSATTLSDNSAGGTGDVFVSQIVTVSPSTQYTFSFFSKADQLATTSMRFVGFTNPTDSRAVFNLSSGSVTISAGDSSTIQDAGNGWYRCAVSFTTDPSDATGTLRIHAGDDFINQDLDGTSSILIYGAQLEVGSSPSSYIATTA